MMEDFHSRCKHTCPEASATQHWDHLGLSLHTSISGTMFWFILIPPQHLLALGHACLGHRDRNLDSPPASLLQPGHKPPRSPF